MADTISLTTSDRETLEAELYRTDAPRGVVAIAHPHPMAGGDMYSPVSAALFRALPELGVTGLRFNFRGVGRSSGVHDEGRAERLDVAAAIESVVAAAPGVPLVVAGWSFGADVSLRVDDDRIAGWFAAAPPLRLDPSTMAAGTAASHKRLAVPEHDQFCPPAMAAERTADWLNTDIAIIDGVDHFFGGLMQPVVDAFSAFVDEICGAGRT